MMNCTVPTAGGAMPRDGLVFDIKRGKYGSCRRIARYVGGEMFAERYFSDLPAKCDVVIFDAEMTGYSLDVSDPEEAIDTVQALVSVGYRSQTTRKAP